MLASLGKRGCGVVRTVAFWVSLVLAGSCLGWTASALGPFVVGPISFFIAVAIQSVLVILAVRLVSVLGR